MFAAGLVLAGIAMADGSGGSRGGNGKETIATATSNGWRVKLVAYRDRSEAPPTADVRISVFKRTRGRWDRLGRSRLVGARGAWFWRVVTRRFGVRQLALRIGRREHPLQAKIRLLRSASLGPSAPFRFVVADGSLRPVDV